MMCDPGDEEYRILGPIRVLDRVRDEDVKMTSADQKSIIV